MIEQNLARHCLEIHNRERCAAGETQITSYFGSQKRKRLESENVSAHSSEDDSAPIADMPPPPSTTELSASTFNDGRLDEILDRVKDIQITVKNQYTTQKGPQPPSQAMKSSGITQAVKSESEREWMNKIQLARSLDNLLQNFSDLKLCQKPELGLGYVICQLCCSEETFAAAEAGGTLNQTNGVVSFSLDTQLTFQQEENLSRSFLNLKKKIKTHIENKTHTTNLSTPEIETEVKRVESRNEAIGMRIARICYFLYKQAYI